MFLLPLRSGVPSFLLAGLVRTSPSSDRLSWSRGSGARDTFATRQVPSSRTTLASQVHKTARSDVPLDASGVTPDNTHAASQASTQALSEDELDAALLNLSFRAQLLPLAPKACSATVAIQDSDSEDLELVCLQPQGQAASRGTSPRICTNEGFWAHKQASQLLMPPSSPCLPSLSKA